jgi:nucleoside-diphosphate-sugar epimerase
MSSGGSPDAGTRGTAPRTTATTAVAAVPAEPAAVAPAAGPAAASSAGPGPDVRASSAPPAAPRSDEELDDLLSAPSPATVDALARCPGDVIVLGAGGKMGPTLTRMLRRSLDALERDGGPRRRVYAVSRWTSGGAERALLDAGVETVRADLTSQADVARLPDVPNVVYMAGQKFGTRDSPASTWAMNVVAPVLCAERYAGSRVVAFSTGNVYPLVPAAGRGAVETDPVAPTGEYAASCVGRERVFEHFSRSRGTPVAIFRLNYAVDLRYGVLVDVALRVLRGEPVSVAMGYANVIWQGDANRAAIECLPHASSPPFVVNVTGTSVLSVRQAAREIGRLLGREPVIVGEEAPDALLSDTTRMRQTLSAPTVPESQLLAWVADWVARGGTLLGKPTKFEVRDGAY